MKATEYKNYIGDINPEYGGFFANLDDWRYGYTDVLRISDLDSGCGFNGAVMIERLTVIGLDNKEKIERALESCGWKHISGITSTGRKLSLVDAMLGYGYYEPDDSWMNYQEPSRVILQLDPDGDMSYDGWNVDYKIDGDLMEWLESNGWLNDMS